ncbi:acyl carrier protein [Flavobacterium sp.]|uniref:acyl carrier protein n=1 Tax=Flavobacterium sp. TaxID=239 RepID=UPI0008C538FF|nr:acyl carrier protein [Flavobacterium sp.]OGS65818.1 MAG: hypothetical protein A2X21_02480 [Flavobacteria bacterium GWA2_35_26]HCF03070.1 acyl carrier protein [Flavobacterium sp.]
MNKQEFLDVIRDQFLEDDISVITFDVNFRNLDSWDSLTGMAILTVIEDDYKVIVPVEEFKKIITIDQLYDYVISKKQ